MIVKRFSTMLWSDRHDAPVAVGVRDRKRTLTLATPCPVLDWSPPELTVVGPTDFLANDLGIRLCSAKLRDIIETSRNDADHVQWLDAVVCDGNGSSADYFVPHFPSPFDVLDPDDTLFAADGVTVVRPLISLERAGLHTVFTYTPYGVAVVIAADVRRKIVSSACTGIYFGTIGQV